MRLLSVRRLLPCLVATPTPHVRPETPPQPRLPWPRQAAIRERFLDRATSDSPGTLPTTLQVSQYALQPAGKLVDRQSRRSLAAVNDRSVDCPVPHADRASTSLLLHFARTDADLMPTRVATWTPTIRRASRSPASLSRLRSHFVLSLDSCGSCHHLSALKLELDPLCLCYWRSSLPGPCRHRYLPRTLPSPPKDR